MALDIGVATLNIHNGSEASGGPGQIGQDTLSAMTPLIV